MAQPSHLIVGLGNPGPDYALTRHNIGFMVLDTLAQELRWQRKFKGEMASLAVDDWNCILLKPMTFMNLSGESVGEAMRFYKLTPDQVIVFHDDLDLDAGRVKVKQGGGSAGHNGLKSMDAHIGSDYRRVRLGIGHPGDKNLVTDYVLGRFAKAEMSELEAFLGRIKDALPFLLKDKTSEFIKKVCGA